MIAIESVHKWYDRLRVLKGVDLFPHMTVCANWRRSDRTRQFIQRILQS